MRRTKAWFDVSYLRDLKSLLSGQTLRASLGILRRAPGSLLHPGGAMFMGALGLVCLIFFREKESEVPA